MSRAEPRIVSGRQALQRLQQGNARFVSGNRRLDRVVGKTNLDDLVGGQHPFAVILGCADSRVPVEIVFDQGMGDLFVLRVAGNIVTPAMIGSVEFAAARFNTRLVVVMGHTRCGAVEATVEELMRDSTQQSPNLRSIVEQIRPAVEELKVDGGYPDRDTLLAGAVRSNVRRTAEALRHGSAILEQQIAHDGLRVVGAEYALETGHVEFFDGLDRL